MGPTKPCRATKEKSKTSDGKTIENRNFEVTGTTNNDTKLEVAYKESAGQRNTVVSSDQAFSYKPVESADGDAGQATDAKKEDGVFRKQFKGKDTVSSIKLGNGNDEVSIKSDSEELTPGAGDDLVELGSGTNTVKAGGEGTDKAYDFKGEAVTSHQQKILSRSMPKTTLVDLTSLGAS